MKTFLTNRAFNLCCLLVFGLAFWPIAVQAQTPIACGQTVNSNTVATSDNDQYTFAGTNGQMVILSLANENGQNGWAPVADLYNPGFTLIATLGPSGGGSGAATNLVLATGGTYTVVIHDNDHAQTGSYGIGIQSSIGGGCSSTPLTCGQVVNTNIALYAQMHAYGFAGASGQMVILSLANENGQNGWAPVADLYNPAGALIATLGPSGGGSGAATNLVLATGGTYTVVIHDDNYAQTGSYGIGIQSSIGGGCSSTPLTCGQAVNTNIALYAQMHAYGFAGTTGEVVILTLSNLGGQNGWSPVADVYNPGGTLIVKLGSSAATNLVLATCGTYTVLVHDDNYAQTGSYSVSRTCLGGGCSNTISTSSSPPAGGSTSGGGTVDCCSTMTVCATRTPNSCYNFVNWTLNSDAVSTSACYTFVATNNETLTANFAQTFGVTNEICGIQVAGTNVAISAQSVGGDTYQLQSRTSMTTGNWSNVAGVSLTNSGGGLIILTNFGGALAPHKFYRLDITP